MEPFTPHGCRTLRQRHGKIMTKRRPSDEEEPAFVYSEYTWIIAEDVDSALVIPNSPFGWVHYIFRPREYPIDYERDMRSYARLIDAKVYVVGPESPYGDILGMLHDAREREPGTWRGDRTVFRSIDEGVETLRSGALKTYETTFCIHARAPDPVTGQAKANVFELQ